MTNINNIKVLGKLPKTFGLVQNTSPVINSNLKIWLDANLGITKDGANLVSNWGDQSGNNNFAFQNTTTYKPLFVSSSASVNNKPTLRFSAPGDDLMNISYNTGLNFASTGFTIYLVGKLNTVFNTYNVLIQHSNGSSWTQGWGLFYFNTDGGYRFFVNNYNNAANYVLLTNSNTSTVSIFKFKYDLTSISAQIISNTQPSSGSKSYSGGLTTPTGNTLLLGGSGATIYDTSFDLPELLVYNTGNLGTPNELQTENYLKAKYGIL